MKWYGPWLFLLFLALSSWIIGGAICGYVLWSHHRQNGKSEMIVRLSGLMWGLSFMGAAQMVANAFGYIVRPEYSLGYAWSYWIGQLVLCVTLWGFALFMLRSKKKYENGERRTYDQEPSSTEI